MEKTMSPEDRIKRAEEIYYRRRSDNSSIRMSSSQVKDGKEKRQISLYKKVIIQVLVCILIYLVFSLIRDANYIFSEEVLSKTKQFLNTDINFEVIAGQVGQFFQDNQDKLNFFSGWLKEDDKKNEQTENRINEDQENGQNAGDANQESNKQENANQENSNGQSNSQTNNTQQNNEQQNTQQSNEQKNNQSGNVTNEAKNDTTSKNNTTTNTQVGIGGASGNEVVTASSSSSSSKKTQMQLDAEYIKKNFSLVLPAKATITSRYGKRKATEIVSENHYGIDIGVNVGTSIVAAMEGKVSVVSDEGDYGTHVKIVNKDVTTIYAHCSKILVKKGATVKKGQKIALSGNTGNTTGPHLHFEIRRNNKTVDPELVLKWS